MVAPLSRGTDRASETASEVDWTSDLILKGGDHSEGTVLHDIGLDHLRMLAMHSSLALPSTKK
jgi:hypothetical protein